jgi:hypothetical protein
MVSNAFLLFTKLERNTAIDYAEQSGKTIIKNRIGPFSRVESKAMILHNADQQENHYDVHPAKKEIGHTGEFMICLKCFVVAKSQEIEKQINEASKATSTSVELIQSYESGPDSLDGTL